MHMRMKHRLFLVCLLTLACFGADSRLTIYNQNFSVVREMLPLDLKQGVNVVNFTGATVHLEPDSVMLRDPEGKINLRILEQDFRAEPISEGLLLSLSEGKEIDFEVAEGRTVRGKIVRSGYVPHTSAAQRYGPQFSYAQSAMLQSGAAQPIVEIAV